jgi:hypothetical protein
MCNHPAYRIWATMIQRCENRKCRGFRWWGEKGITVCKEWHDSKTFLNWALSHGYKTGLSIDRIKNHGNYEPSNCQWITRSENAKKENVQNFNRRNSRNRSIRGFV